MKQPYIFYQGKKLKVSSIDWHNDEIVTVSFRDKNNVFLTAFQSGKYLKKGRHTGSLHLDLKNRVTAEER